MARKFAR